MRRARREKTVSYEYVLWLFSVPAYTNTKIAVIEGDAVDVAIELGITIGKPDQVALVNMANDKRAGGDWEAGKFRYVSDDIHF